MKTKSVSILLVEDDEVDATAINRCFNKNKIANPIVRAKDGVHALEILRGENGAEQIESPCIILLDLNMPRMSGLEFLDEIRNDPKLAHSVVFVLTTSSAEEDQWAAYEKNVAGYLVKSKIGDDFMKLVELLQGYWRVVELPEIPVGSTNE